MASMQKVNLIRSLIGKKQVKQTRSSKLVSRFLAACIQLNSKRNIEENLPDILCLVDEAIGDGAKFISLPECTGMMEPVHELLRKKASIQMEDPVLSAIRGKAAAGGVWILIGSLATLISDGKIANRSYLVDSNGNLAATYDKIHMFDVSLNAGQSYRESKTYEPGTEAVLADLPWGSLGLTICYDVRFAYLYRTLAQNGAYFITVPSAFTKISGEGHWHVLQRARAIETGCYVISAAQCGTHAEGRQTYGHSLIVDPWGCVLADGGEDVGIIMANIDPSQVEEARAKIPALTHDRSFELLSSQTDEQHDNLSIVNC